MAFGIAIAYNHVSIEPIVCIGRLGAVCHLDVSWVCLSQVPMRLRRQVQVERSESDRSTGNRDKGGTS